VRAPPFRQVVRHRARCRLLAALAEPATTTDLARALDVTPGAVFQHLGVLRAAGLVSAYALLS
jgi:DNA-binding transcriptional ArsR family regulator